MPPREAAKQIGVSVSTLRRLATIYESVHGALPWEGEENGGGRLWTDEAVERVAAAKALVAEGRSKSIDNALRALKGGVEPPMTGPLARPEPDIVAALAAIVEPLVSEVTALRGEVAELKASQRQLLSHTASADGTDVNSPDQAGGERVEPHEPTSTAHGVVVRTAMRLERLWRRVTGRP